jgi:deoxyribose-phosphate aldolase
VHTETNQHLQNSNPTDFFPLMTDLARTLDAAVLKPEMTTSEAEAAMRECVALRVRTVCVRPCDIALARRICAGTETGVCVVLGFPHGTQLPESKVDEARRYLEAGVEEIDMVANYGWIRSGRLDDFRREVEWVLAVTRQASIPVKVILETSQLSIEQTRAATAVCRAAGAAFVKTSTGFNGVGATREHVEAMVAEARGQIGVKASGGIRTRAEAEAFLSLGATRLGVGFSSCAAICSGTTTAVADSAY